MILAVLYRILSTCNDRLLALITIYRTWFFTLNMFLWALFYLRPEPPMNIWGCQVTMSSSLCFIDDLSHSCLESLQDSKIKMSNQPFPLTSAQKDLTNTQTSLTLDEEVRQWWVCFTTGVCVNSLFGSRRILPGKMKCLVLLEPLELRTIELNFTESQCLVVLASKCSPLLRMNKNHWSTKSRWLLSKIIDVSWILISHCFKNAL